MPEKRRAHPITILFNLGRVFYLVVIPLIRGFVSALGGGLASWAAGAWMDILVFALMLGIAVFAWLTAYFVCNERALKVSSGLWRRRDTVIPWGNVTTVSITESFYLRPFGALLFRADTLGGSFKDSDFTILLSRKQAKAVMDTRRAFAGAASGSVYQPATSSVIALSLFSSNSFGGVLLISAFISQAGKLLGGGFSRALIGTFENMSRTLAFGIPPAAAAIGYILLAGWFMGFLLLFCRYKDFTLTRRENILSKNILSIKGGVFTKREYNIMYCDINFIDIRQSVTTKLLKLSSLYISAVGYGKHKDDISCVIPAERENRFAKSFNAVFPAFTPVPRQISPRKSGILRFIGQPVFTLCAIAAAAGVFVWFFPEWKAFILFTGLMSVVPALLFLLVSIEDFRSCGIAFDGQRYTLRYSAGFFLHTVVIPGDKIAVIELRRSFFQKLGPYCDVIISSRAEGRSLHRCRGLVLTEALELLGI